MPLATLSKSGRLPKLGYSAPRNPSLTAGGGQTQLANPSDKLVPIPPRQSPEEEWIWRYIIKRNEYWYSQKWFGEPNTLFSTRVDFINDMLKAVIYANGAYFHDQTVALDEVKYSVVRQRGYRVFPFRYETYEYVVKFFPAWYQQVIG